MNRLCGRIDGTSKCAETCWKETEFGEECPPRLHHPSCPWRDEYSAVALDLACIGCPV